MQTPLGFWLADYAQREGLADRALTASNSEVLTTRKLSL